MTAELERHHQLLEPPPRIRVGHDGRSVVGAQGCERVELEIRPLPEVGDDGAQHRGLLVGGAAIDVDCAEQRARHRPHHLGSHHHCHDAKLPGSVSFEIVSCMTMLRVRRNDAGPRACASLVADHPVFRP